MIGKGGYGEVYLVRKIDTREVLALKKIKKSAILKSQTELTHLRTERNVLASQDSRWLVQLMYSFQDANNVYMAMEFIHGGDVRTRLTQVETMPEGTCAGLWARKGGLRGSPTYLLARRSHARWAVRSLFFVLQNTHAFTLPKCSWPWTRFTKPAISIAISNPRTSSSIRRATSS